MKINVRLLLITFTVTVIISLSSTLIYYSTTTSLLKNQHSNVLLNSTTDFNIAFQNIVASLDNELYEITEDKEFKSSSLNELDFVFRISDNKEIISESFVYSSNIDRTLFTNSLDDFLTKYPNVILKYYQNNEEKPLFFGKLITEEFLNILSEKIRADIVLVVNNAPYVASNKSETENYAPYIIEAIRDKGNLSEENVFYKEFNNGDFFAKRYSPQFLFWGKPIEFVVFKVHTDLAEFREKMQAIAITIALAGVLLSLIFVLLFTAKIRKQISLLNKAAIITAEGNLSHRVPVLSKDELGNLGKVFNNMLEHIQENEKIERDYSELIAIINRTPILKELTDSVLEKIVTTTKIPFGVFYLVNNGNAKPISTHGIDHAVLESHDSGSFYADVINNKKTVELTFDDNSPIIKTGIAEIKIKYLVIMPIVFNDKIIGIIELACEHIPEKKPIDYLDKIKYQLAVGLSSAISYEQLENLVDELKLLNEQYQKQNLQISEQNFELLNLHNELKEQANELEKQRKKAVELSHVKSQFLANMSHELRTPLNSILGLTELIENDISTFPKTKERLKIVLRNGKKLLAMINNILEFSKIESGKFEVTKSNFAVSEFLLDIYNAMEPLVTEKGLNFEVLFESEFDLLINSDRHKLEQVLLNLLSNAIKFTDVGGIKIVVTYNNVSLKIDVVDSGIGISEEDQKKIFNEFEQVDFTSSRKYQGAGLGLAICKKYVELLGGKIYVMKNSLSGATFSVTLNNVVLEKFTINKKFYFKNSIANSEQKLKRVIISKSDNDNNHKFSNYFRENNYDVIESNAGVDIIWQLEHSAIDGIIVNISSLDSWNIICELKESKYAKEITFFFMSEFESEKVFYSPLISDFITDDVDTEYLKNQINLIDVQYQKVKSIVLVSRYNEKIEERITSIGSNISVTKSSTNDIGTINIEAKTNLIIVDADLFTLHVWEKVTGAGIPMLILINKEMIENNLEAIYHTWQIIGKQYLQPSKDIFSVLNHQISMIKEIKSSKVLKLEEVGDDEGIINSSQHNFHVLIVDDDNDTQFTVGEILQNIGCQISYANNGVECLTVLKDLTPDLILLDIMMPIMDGFETIKKIRLNEKTKNLLVYAITAQAMLDDIEIIKNSGFDDLITKPVNASTLSLKIKEAIQKRS